MEMAIRTRGLCKQYKSRLAADHVDMNVQKGDIYGFIGRNGSGKSTTLKMLCGLIRPTGGEIELFGMPVHNEAVRRRTGVLIESAGIYKECSARENLLLKAAAMGLVDAEKQADEALRAVGLEAAGKKPAKAFSMGMKQRLGVALALLGGPDLLLLDEPINGLDPEGIQEIRRLLVDLNRRRGVTLVVSSHILGELSRIATRYGILKDGRMVREISAEELAAQCMDYLYVRTDDAKKAAVALEQALGLTRYEVRPEGELRVYGPADAAAVTGALAARGVGVQAVYPHKQDLESYFLDLMGGERDA